MPAIAGLLGRRIALALFRHDHLAPGRDIEKQEKKDCHERNKKKQAGPDRPAPQGSA